MRTLRITRSMFAMLVAIGALIVLHAPAARAQEETKPAQDEAQPEAPPSEPAEDQADESEDSLDDPVDDPLGDLDELLDIPEEDRQAPRAGGEELEDLDSDRQELERRLTAQELSDQFKQAIAQMGEAADRMKRIGDVGLQTQRLQTEVLTKLDVLIEQQKQSGKGKPQGSPQNADQQGQQPNQPQQGQQNQSQASEGQNTSENDPPPFEAGELERRLDLSQAEWGQLPERLRELLIQGIEGKHSALYEKLTQEFYRRIAEEGEE